MTWATGRKKKKPSQSGPFNKSKAKAGWHRAGADVAGGRDVSVFSVSLPGGGVAANQEREPTQVLCGHTNSQ